MTGTSSPTWQDLLPVIASAMPSNSDPDGSIARTSEADRVCKDNIPALVGWILRHCTATERGAMLADRWNHLHYVTTTDTELELHEEEGR